MSNTEEKEIKLCPLKPWVTAGGTVLSEIFCKVYKSKFGYGSQIIKERRSK